MKRYFLGVGDTNDLNCWSGTAHFILKSAKKSSFNLQGIDLNYKKLFIAKILWNIKYFLMQGKYSGFQYSDYFLKNLIYKSDISVDKKLTLISYYPCLPAAPWSEKWSIYYYIDATTKQVFDDYKLFKSISKSYRERILDKEKSNYIKSKAIFCMSDWAKDSLVKDYKISSNKIFVHPGGANIDTESLSNFNKDNSIPLYPSELNPLRIGFLGKEWERKGGPFLYSLIKYLNHKGIPSSLRVVGLNKRVIPKSKYIKYIGPIDKSINMDKFISEICSWHYGSLFSVSEAYGISNRECLMLGVPVIGNNVGGIPSTIPDEQCGKLFDLNDHFSKVGDWIINQMLDYRKYSEMRLSLSKRSYEFSWDYTLKNLFKKISLTESKI